MCCQLAPTSAESTSITFKIRQNNKCTVMTILKYERISFQGLLKMLARHTKPSAFLLKPPTLPKVKTLPLYL